MLGYVSLAGQSVAVAGVIEVVGIAEIAEAVEARHRRNIFDEVVEVERTLLSVPVLACRCLVGIEVLGSGHFGIRPVDCMAVGGMSTAGSQTAALERRVRSDWDLPHILI